MRWYSNKQYDFIFPSALHDYVLFSFLGSTQFTELIFSFSFFTRSMIPNALNDMFTPSPLPRGVFPPTLAWDLSTSSSNCIFLFFDARELGS